MNYDKQFCVFIDILGFKNRMKNFDDVFVYYKKFFAAFDTFDKMHSDILQEVSDVLHDDLSQNDNLLPFALSVYRLMNISSIS